MADATQTEETGQREHDRQPLSENLLCGGPVSGSIAICCKRPDRDGRKERAVDAVGDPGPVPGLEPALRTERERNPVRMPT